MVEFKKGDLVQLNAEALENFTESNIESTTVTHVKSRENNTQLLTLSNSLTSDNYTDARIDAGWVEHTESMGDKSEEHY